MIAYSDSPMPFEKVNDILSNFRIFINSVQSK